MIVLMKTCNFQNELRDSAPNALHLSTERLVYESVNKRIRNCIQQRQHISHNVDIRHCCILRRFIGSELRERVAEIIQEIKNI